jgi:BED zinc finger
LFRKFSKKSQKNSRLVGKELFDYFFNISLIPFIILAMSVWAYATKRKNPITKELEGQCQRCNKIIKCSGNSTTTLKNHLKSHGICFDKATESTTLKDESGSEKRQETIGDFLERKTLKEIISDLATDGISIRAITRNKYIGQSIARDGFKLPANESDVMKLLHEHFD